jgi:hypothetical protein
LTVCGLGIDRPADTSLGTIQALKECDVLFYIHGDGPSLRPFLESFCRDVRIFVDSGPSAPKTARKIALVAKEVCLELKKGRNVAYVTYGHPMIFSDGFNVIKRCRAQGYECRVLPAVSSVDAILASSKELYGTFPNDFVVCSAATVMRTPEMLKLGLPLILLCLEVVSDGGKYGALCDMIEAAYPSGQRIYAIKCRDTYGESVCLSGRVRDARAWEGRIVHMMSLVLPRPAPRPH